MDFEAHNATMDKFQTEIGPAMQAHDTVKEHAKGMMQAFCVMVLQQKINVATGKSTGSFQNFRQMVGKQESIDACRKVMEELVGDGAYEIIPRERAM